MADTVLLTGATGLVGSRLGPRLVQSGVRCRALVRREADLPSAIDQVHGDVTDASSLDDALDGVDAVVHLAAVFRTTDESAVWAVNLEGTRTLLEAVGRNAPGARFVMASTSNVYSADNPRPSREDDPCGATAAYPASKLAAERLVRDSGLTWAILRFPFVYGDGDGHLQTMPTMAQQFGMHPAHTFSVAHHRDIATAVTRALAGTMDGLTVNIADDHPVSVLEMAEFAGDPIPGSSEPLAHPWSGRVDTALARGLGIRLDVPTMSDAARRGIL